MALDEGVKQPIKETNILYFQSQQFHNKLNEILDLISQPQQSPGGTPRKAKCEEESVPIYEMQFPELFIY